MLKGECPGRKYRTSLGLEQVVEIKAGIMPKEMDSLEDAPVFKGMWPTPKEGDGYMGFPRTSGRPIEKVTHLGTAAKYWTTPRTSDTNGPGAHGDGGLDLRTAASYPSPRASDYKGAGPLGSKSHHHHLEKGYLEANIQEKQQATGALNPDWVEWLMGWPIGWTRLDPLTELLWLDWSVDPADMGEPIMLGTFVSTNLVRSDEFKKGRAPTPIEYTEEKGAGSGPVPRLTTVKEHRRQRLMALGNGQVPACFAEAWRILSEAHA